MYNARERFRYGLTVLRVLQLFAFESWNVPLQPSLSTKSVTVVSTQLAFKVEILILVQLWCLLLPVQLPVNPFARVRRVIQIALVAVIFQQPIVLR